MEASDKNASIENLEQLVDRIEQLCRERERVSVGAIFEAVGERSFGALLLVPGLIVFSPLSGIPGMATLMGTLVVLVSVQLLFRRRHLWLPHWILDRSLGPAKLGGALRWLHAPSRCIDHWLRPRLHLLVGGAGAYLVALVCTVIGAAMPAMEIVPFSSSVAGATIAVFGTALIARDGLLALIAFALTAVVVGLLVYHLL